MKSSVKILAAVGILAFGAERAQATTFAISLTGVTANFNSYAFNSGGFHYEGHDLVLSGLSPDNPFTVSQGDVINETVQLDAPLTISASPDHTDFLSYFTGSNFPNENTGVVGSMSFYLNGSLVRTDTINSTTSNQLSSYDAMYGAKNVAITFDSFTNNVTITDLMTQATLDGASVTYDNVSSVVPEPAAWALMLAGFGLVAGAMRATRRAKAVASAA